MAINPFTVAIIAGFVLIAVVWLLLHLRFRSQSRRIAESIHSALQGNPVDADQGYFVDVFKAVDEVTGEISRLRQKARVQRRITELSEITDVGIVVVDRRIDFVHATAPAADLFQLGSDGEGWTFVKSVLGDLIEVGMHGEIVDLTLPARSIRCQIHTLPDRAGYLLLVRDNSLIHSLESDLRVAAYSRGLARLYMGIAHDFKAPLSALLLNLELLESSIEAGVQTDSEREDQRRWISIVEEEIGRLRRAFDALLQFTAPPKDEKQTFDIREVTEELTTLLKPQARQQSVEVRTSIPNEPLLSTGHRDRIKQALLNVAINALEVMPVGGVLELNLRGTFEHVVLAIRDTGPGIPEEIRDRIFSMHFTTKETGTGIGLYVSRSIIDGEGGTLELVESGEGGTMFEVTITRGSSGPRVLGPSGVIGSGQPFHFGLFTDHSLVSLPRDRRRPSSARALRS